jgi:hypothetical protein
MSQLSSRLALLAVIVYSLCACEDRGAAPGSGTSKDPPAGAGISLAASPLEMAAGQTATTFNFGTLREMAVRVTLPEVPRRLLLTLKFFGPNGENVYEETRPFSNGEAMTEEMVPGMPGVAHPWPVVPAMRAPGGEYALDRTIPVAATVLTKHGSEGTWHVEATSDGFTGTLTRELTVYFRR